MPSGTKEDVIMKDEQLISEVGKNNVEIIREWLSKQLHLPNISDKQLVIFLNCCQCHLERTKKMIDNYYTIRTHSPEMFANKNILEFQKTFDIYYIHKLPVLLSGRRVGFSRLRDFNSNHFNTLDTIRLVFAMYDICVNEDPLAPEWNFVMDMTGFSVGHLTKLTNLSLMKKCLNYIQTALPMRLTAVYMINAPPLVNQLMIFLKKLMHKDLYSLISIYPANDIDSFYKIIPKEYFASDMGGQAPSFEELRADALTYFERYDEKFFNDDNKFNSVDESKRIDKSRFNSTYYGLEGSFKKIELD